MSQNYEKVERVTVPALEEILGKKFNILNDGFIRVVDYMGGDSSIVQAARVSYGAGTKKVSEDRGLIRYLLKHRHTTPFEMADLKLHVRVPMDAWRQWIRHRTASVNETSSRYSIVTDSTQTTNPNEWRSQAKDNKQGSGDYLPEDLGKKFSAEEEDIHKILFDSYNEKIDAGVAKEQARKDLPLCTYTEAYWKMDLHNLLNFLRLRMDSHAQKEIREYATVIGEEIVSKWVPHTWEAFNDYSLNSMHLSRMDKEALNLIVTGNYDKNSPEVREVFGVKPGKKSREHNEFISKLETLFD
ncbi:FAD-dependent thymidylate synthase [Candidatus Woesearchaeota archaeon]|jgi:thymidylate synthase (FAD)|nr:FAD-dependent thymidylate synthase [Candidatus Woesearchaeota archaeon]MBT7237545.1 FAD-dependent thymidylate synthase [Candidatus Woesearchaeota archaeon]